MDIIDFLATKTVSNFLEVTVYIIIVILILIIVTALY